MTAPLTHGEVAPRQLISPESSRRCVHRHPLKSNTAVTHDGIVRCTWTTRGEACDALLFVALVHVGGSAVIRGEGERMWLVVEITEQQKVLLVNQPMSVHEKLAYIGVAIP